MKNIGKHVSMVLLLTMSGVMHAQESNPTTTAGNPNAAPVAEVQDGVPLFKVVVVARDLPAIN
jgi:hypothetical protein